MTCAQLFLLLISVFWVNTTAIQDLICAPGNNAITATAQFTNLTFDEIIQPNYPDGHDAMKCVWTLTASQPTHRMKIVIKTLSLSDERDRLYIYDGARIVENSKIGFYGPCANGTLILYSTGPSMTIVLVSTKNAARGKLRVLFKALPRDWITCEAKNNLSDSCLLENITPINRRSGHLTSPGFPSNFSHQTICTWKFYVPSDHRMQITFEWMGLYKDMEHGLCELDNMIKLSDGYNSHDYCGCDQLPVIDSTRTLWMKLLATPHRYRSGFLLTYRTVSLDDCPIGQTDCLQSHETHGFNKEGQLCSDIDIAPTTPRPTTISTAPPTTTEAPTTNRRVDNPEEQVKEENPTERTTRSYIQGLQAPDDENKRGSGKFTVQCNRDYMEVSINLARFEANDALVPGSLRLEDASCKPYFINETLAVFRAPLDGCGTYHNATKEDIYYWNTIHAHTEETGHRLITRKYSVRLGFDCRYAKRRTLSVVSYSPRKKVVYSAADGRGNFTFLMDMYKTDQYKEPYDRYPVIVALNQRLYLQVVVKSKVELVIFPDTCMATPTSEINDEHQYKFIEKGCSRDNTLIFNYKLAPVQQFSIAAFRFTNSTQQNLYIHCMVQVCMKSDNTSVCADGCIERHNSSASRSRKRRSSWEYAQSEDLEFLTLGPLRVDRRNQEIAAETKKALLPNVLMIGIVAGVLGLVVVALTAAIVVVLVKKAHRLKAEVYYQTKLVPSK